MSAIDICETYYKVTHLVLGISLYALLKSHIETVEFRTITVRFDLRKISSNNNPFLKVLSSAFFQGETYLET